MTPPAIILHHTYLTHGTPCTVVKLELGMVTVSCPDLLTGFWQESKPQPVEKFAEQVDRDITKERE